MYSVYTNRLGGVTQVVSPDLNVSYMHNRQTHSVKVSLLAGELAQDINQRAKLEPQTKRLLNTYGGLDVAACEAAGLAHDLGHPPFGHVSERVLDNFLLGQGSFQSEKAQELLKPISGHDPSSYSTQLQAPLALDGFEGNAQSFRTVVRLDTNRPAREGLDLTRVTLSAILKYPWWRDNSAKKYDRKFGAYSSDVDTFVWAREWVPAAIGPHRQTLEAAVMDVADDLTYAIHDLQDFFMCGLIDPQSLLVEIQRQRAAMRDGAYRNFVGLSASEQEGIEAEEALAGRPPTNTFELNYRDLARYYGSFVSKDAYEAALAEVEDLFRNDLNSRFSRSAADVGKIISSCSRLLGKMIAAVDLHRTEAWSSGPFIYIDGPQWHLAQVLKQVTKGFVVDTPFVGMTQRAQRAAITTLLRGLDDWLRTNPTYGELPEPLSSYLKAQYDTTQTKVNYDFLMCRRAIVDYVCSLTDSEALERSRWFAGVTSPRLPNSMN